MKKKITICAALATASAVTMHIVNKSIFSLSLLKNILDRNQGYYYEWRFGKIFYTKQGSGSPLLLIHDLDTCSCSYEWNETVKHLALNHTVYTLDLLGCGRSEKPNLTYTNFLYVQLISDFVKSIIGKKTDVITTGLSGSFTLMACHNDEKLFNHIILVNPESLIKLNKIPSKNSKTVRFLLNIPILGTLIYNIAVSKKNISEKYENLPEKYLDAFYEAAHTGDSCSKFLFSSIKGRYVNSNIIHALKQINNSISIIISEDIQETGITDDYTVYNPSIETSYIQNGGYLPQVNKPYAFLEQAEIFLN